MTFHEYARYGHKHVLNEKHKLYVNGTNLHHYQLKQNFLSKYFHFFFFLLLFTTDYQGWTQDGQPTQSILCGGGQSHRQDDTVNSPHAVIGGTRKNRIDAQTGQRSRWTTGTATETDDDSWIITWYINIITVKYWSRIWGHPTSGHGTFSRGETEHSITDRLVWRGNVTNVLQYW